MCFIRKKFFCQDVSKIAQSGHTFWTPLDDKLLKAIKTVKVKFEPTFKVHNLSYFKSYFDSLICVFDFLISIPNGFQIVYLWHSDLIYYDASFRSDRVQGSQQIHSLV